MESDKVASRTSILGIPMAPGLRHLLFVFVLFFLFLLSVGAAAAALNRQRPGNDFRLLDHLITIASTAP